MKHVAEAMASMVSMVLCAFTYWIAFQCLREGDHWAFVVMFVAAGLATVALPSRTKEQS